MRTNIVVDDSVVARAFRHSLAETKKDLVQTTQVQRTMSAT